MKKGKRLINYYFNTFAPSILLSTIGRLYSVSQTHEVQFSLLFPVPYLGARSLFPKTGLYVFHQFNNDYS